MQITSMRVAIVIARLNWDQSYPKAQSKGAVYLHQLSAAQRYGIYEPFDEDAAELNRWLSSIQAGRALCHAAWDLFMDDGVQAHGKRA